MHISRPFETERTHTPSRSIVFQWHITERCNLRCAHCYQEDYQATELPFQKLIEITKQFKALLDTLGRQTGVNQSRGHINITGGEPFIRRDFLDLLEFFTSCREWLI